MYHRVTPEPHPAFLKYCVTPKAFANQMRFLSAAKYTPIDFNDFLSLRDGRGKLPEKPIVITFDDGFQDIADNAVPILSERGFKAAIYFVTALAGKQSSWILPSRGVEFPLMDWGTIKDLEKHGIQCGAHSSTHPKLTEISLSDCRSELLNSRLELENRLGREIRHLAYPFGLFNRDVRDIAEDTGYYTACSTQIGISSFKEDLLSLRRVPINGQDSLFDFIFKLKTAHTIGEYGRSKARGAKRLLKRIIGTSKAT
ncbi:MAG: polysaccharide deacetylase family protein [Deltaproteobacteria bacterium]